MFTLQVAGCNYQYGLNFGVHPESQPFGSDDFSSLGKVYSRQATESVNCENSSVSFVITYCPTTTVVKNPASVQILFTLSCCDKFSIRSWYFRNRFSSCCAGSSVVRINHKFIWSMRNSDPGLSVVFTQRPNSDFDSMFTIQATGRDFQHGSNFYASLDPSFRLWCFFVSWKSVLTTGHCMTLWEFCSVFRHEVLLSNLNNTHESCIDTKIYSIYLVVTAFQFVLHIVAKEKFHSLGHHNPKELLSWSRLARVRNLIALPQRVAPFDREKVHILHKFLRLLRKDWAELQKQICEK